MKRILIALVAVLSVSAISQKVSAQTEQTRQVSGFTGIGTGGAFDVHVKIDGTESLKLSGPADILKDIETVVEDGRLEIRFKKDKEKQYNHEDNSKIKVDITAKSLSSLSIGGAGAIKVDGTLTGDNVRLSIGGSGNITSAIKSGNLHVSIGGAGTLNLNGSADNATFSIGGSGNINAKDLKIGMASISMAGSGSAHINVEKSIKASIAGSGHITYSGNASITNFSAAGSGSISKEKGE